MLSGRVRARDDDNEGDLPPPKRHKQARRSAFSEDKINWLGKKDPAKEYYNRLFRSPFWIKMGAQVRPYHRFAATKDREAFIMMCADEYDRSTHLPALYELVHGENVRLYLDIEIEYPVEQSAEDMHEVISKSIVRLCPRPAGRTEWSAA